MSGVLHGDDLVIDVHGHLGPWFFAQEVGDVAVNIATMDRYGIDLQIVSATEAIVYDVAGGNAALARVLEGQPRLRGYVTVDPRRVDLAAADLDRYWELDSFVGAKIHTDYSRTPIDTPAMGEAFDLLDERDVPTLVHTWGDSVIALADAVSRRPRLRAIAGHSGAAGYRFAREAARWCDRVWFEPCYSHAPAGRLRWLADHLPPDRLLFGTDATLIDPSVALGGLRAAELSPDAVRAVLTDNAQALFGDI